jgi:PAS domain-containing protein
MGSLVILMTLMVVYSFYNKQANTLFVTSVVMQFTFILCDLKTTHHTSSETNHHIVRNACSARLILMALETSHLTSLAIETSWIKYFCVNFINFLMFTVLVFMEIDIETATFWDLGQIGSIFASAIASLIIYHHLVERINGQNEKARKQLTDAKDSFMQVAENIPNGIIIVQDGKINFVNKICSKILSSIFQVNNLIQRTSQKSLIDRSKILD